MSRRLPERLQWIGHALLGVVFVLKGWAKAEHWPEHAFFVALFIGAGLVVFLGTALHGRLAPHLPQIDALFYFLEAVVLAGMSWLYFEAGKRALPWVTGATAVAFGVLTVWRLVRPRAHAGSPVSSRD